MEKGKYKILKETFLVENKIPFLLKGMDANTQDEDLLKKWGFDIPVYSDFENEEKTELNFKDRQSSASHEDSFYLKLDQDTIKKKFEIFLGFQNKLQEYTLQLFKKINSSQPEFLQNPIEQKEFKELIEILDFLKKFKDEFILFMNTHLDSDHHGVNMYGFGLNALLGLELKCSKKELEEILLASIVSKIFFFNYSVAKIKLMFVKNNFTIDSPSFLKKHLVYTIDLLKKSNFPSEIKNLIVYQSEAVDGSGLLRQSNKNISLAANILSFVRTYLWHYHPFSSVLYEHPPFVITNIFKKRSKFFPEIISAFIKAIGIFEVGSALSFEYNSEKKLAIVIHNNGAKKKPTVKIIMNDYKQVDYSRNLINIDNLNLKFSPISNLVVIKNLQSVFKNNIYNNRYTL